MNGNTGKKKEEDEYKKKETVSLSPQNKLEFHRKVVYNMDIIFVR